jgi:hypothetical protein
MTWDHWVSDLNDPLSNAQSHDLIAASQAVLNGFPTVDGPALAAFASLLG